MLTAEAILRVLGENETSTAGTAFATRFGLVTCAHVVAAAADPPRIFRGSDTAFPAEVTHHGSVSNTRDDWAVLSPRDDLDLPTLPVSRTIVAGHPFSTFGYPVSWEMGNYATGRIGSANAAVVYELIGDRDGFRIRPGFSGAPLWDDIQGRVVGIVVGSDAQLEQRVAFMVPISSLANEVFPDDDETGEAFSDADLIRLTEFAAARGGHALIQNHLLRDRLPRLLEDPVSRYWLYLTVGEVGGTAARADLRQAAERETHSFARGGAVDALDRMAN